MKNSWHNFWPARVATPLLIAIVVIGWLCLYLDSLHERHEAERLISDLRTFPFGTADFVEVRTLAIRYGGHAVESFPHLPFLAPGVPAPPTNSRLSGPSALYQILFSTQIRPMPTCTPKNCVFEIWIRPHVMNLRFSYNTGLFLMSCLSRIGLRPWTVCGQFEVRGGKLWQSETSVSEIQHARIGPYIGFFPMQYEVVSKSEASMPTVSRGVNRYDVGAPVITGVSNVLETFFIQGSRVPIARAFDIRLRCFSAVTHACRGFPELAPSAWAAYQTEMARRLK